jgi:hypothetical protein
VSGNFTVISNEDALLFENLKKMYKEVCVLTAKHDVLNESAVVYPSKLGPILEKVDKEWYKNYL